MKNKRYIWNGSPDLFSGIVGINGQVYDIGVKQVGYKVGDACTVLFEQTSDGGKTWVTLATFTMDDATEIVVPAVYVSGDSIRVTATNTGGFPVRSVWISEVQ